MKLALIQTKQNELYNFPGTRTFDTEEVLRLRHEYMEEVFRMAEEAAIKIRRPLAAYFTSPTEK